MASMTIRNIDETVKKRLRLRAAENGRSLEAEARDILSRSAAVKQPSKHRKTGLDLFDELRRVAERFGGVDLEPFPDETLHVPKTTKRPK